MYKGAKSEGPLCWEILEIHLTYHYWKTMETLCLKHDAQINTFPDSKCSLVWEHCLWVHQRKECSPYMVSIIAILKPLSASLSLSQLLPPPTVCLSSLSHPLPISPIPLSPQPIFLSSLARPGSHHLFITSQQSLGRVIVCIKETKNGYF